MNYDRSPLGLAAALAATLYLVQLTCLAEESVGVEDRSPSREQLDFFESAVRPLLVEHCYECHSASAERVEGSLVLDSRQGHLQGGDSGAAIYPGDSDQSLLIESVRYESYEMPPSGQLDDRDIEILARWVDMGAPWPTEPEPSSRTPADGFDLAKRKSEFWAWQPIGAETATNLRHDNWSRNEIDAYILSGLNEAGLTPSVDTDRNALLRRLHFDLIGLPPSPADVQAFIGDDSPNALENVVDRLLDSQHFGERWGRHWLDLVRYAESRGHEFDNDTPNAFQYRDYVIRALNEDVPYDQFVREHIAGDLIADPRLHPTKGFNESVLGTGFWFLGEWVHSPVDIRKDESDRFDNMIDVMSKTFLGVTVACARCHDHKFDAISTADYYALSGFLQSSDYRQVRFESIATNRRIANEMERVDKKYQRRVLDLLKSEGIHLPSPTRYLNDPGIVVDYANIKPDEYLQDGFIFGRSPRRAGQAILEATSGSIGFVTYGAAVSDPIWSNLESVTEGAVQNRSRIAKLPKSGRTLRSPTFELTDGKVDCRVDGAGHIVACVDSHRMVAGPLHQQTIVPVKEGQRWVTLNLDRYVGHRLHLEFIPAKQGQISVRVVTQGLDAKRLSELDRRMEALDEPFRAFAKQANLALHRPGGTAEERVFADFESGSYEGWKVTGQAFGSIPQTRETVAPYQGRIDGHGKYFVNSHNIRDGGDVRKGDSLTGTLTSSEFEIDFKRIEFLVGGGKHQGRTCINLIVDGEIVRSTTGSGSNRLSPSGWNVHSFAGQMAKIQIVDNHTAGWGNIGIDHIVFKGTIPSGELHRDPEPRSGAVESPQTSPAVQASDRIAQTMASQWMREREELASKIVRTSRVAPAMMDGTGENDRILIRGNASKPGEMEPRHFLSAISGNASMSISTGSGRLELAEHINDARNPLTSRVIVNRIWHHLMGRGIVPTVDDFGFLGQRPTHPKLLDHLAQRFLFDGRSIKRMIKYIVMSRTYRMSSHTDPHAIETDPKNLLWHHRPPRRLQGEVIRDSLLAVSGRMDPTAFGPPVPIHLTEFMDGRGRPPKSGPLDGRGRRSIYIAVRRNFISPFMLTFDTPAPFSSMGRRNMSNVPAQALILLNDPLVAELSQHWGSLAVANVPGSDAESLSKRLEWMYLSGFGRSPSEDERQIAAAFIASQADRRGVMTDDSELWAVLAHALVNTKEFIFLR
ncbi:MAG: PSD1 and planctomycete cytochrome C domain-containing protein [Planctomycetota bacterium]